MKLVRKFFHQKELYCSTFEYPATNNTNMTAGQTFVVGGTVVL